MKLRFFEYFIIFAFAGAIFVTLYDLPLGFSYFVTAIFMTLPYYLFGKYLRDKHAYIFIVLVIWLTHMLRPLLLIPNKELFKYFRLGLINNGLIETSIWKIGIYSLLLLSGFCLSSLTFGFNNKYKKAFQNGKYMSTERLSILVYKKEVIKNLILFGVLTLATLNFVFKVGVKLSAAKVSGVLIFLVPEALIISLCLLNIFEYKIYVKYYCSILVFIVFLGLLGGSKGAFAEIAILLVFYFLHRKGNFKLNFSKVFFVAIVSIFFLFLSFSIANQIKYEFLVHGREFNFTLLSVMFSGFLEVFDPSNILHFADLVTTRFNGFDGLLATEIYQSDLLKEAFSFTNTIRRIVAKLVPFDGGIPIISSGKVVGIEYFGFSEDKSFSGAVGLWGTMQLMAGQYSQLAAFCLGGIWAYLLTRFQRIKDPDVSFLSEMLVVLMITETVMSGNLDNTVSWFIIRIVQLKFYLFIFELVFLKGRRVSSVLKF